MTSTQKRLTIEEKERIIELKLQRVSVRKIAEDVGCTLQTVQSTWNKYLKTRAEERRATSDRQFEEAIARLEQNAIDSRRGYQRSLKDDDLGAATRFLAQEQRALVDIAKLGPVRDTEPEQQARIAEATEKALQQSLSPIVTALDETLKALNLSDETRLQAQKTLADKLRQLRG